MTGSIKFVDNLSIHGVCHIFNGGKFKKVFWIVAIFGSLTLLCFYNYQLFLKLSQIPDISVRIGQKFITEIPFPAITICTPVFAKNSLVSFFNVTKSLRLELKYNLNLTVQEQNYLASNIHTCTPEFAGLVQRIVRNRTRNDIVKLLDESFLPLSEALLNCGSKSFMNDCTNIFYRVLTDRRYCYSYNLQGFETIFNEKVISDDFSSYKRFTITKHTNDSQTIEFDKNEIKIWTLDKGYTSNSNQIVLIPEKIVKGQIFGANAYLNENDSANLCTPRGNSFSYYLHLPNEIMLPFHQEHYVEFRRKKDIVLTATSYTADDSMRKFSPISRGCYFEGEKILKFFKTYTKALCEFECMTNYTLKKCGCVKFSMPRASGTTVCTVDKENCYFDAMSAWPDHRAFNDRFEATCGCLKTCNNIKYDVKFEKISTSENVMVIFDVLKLSKDAAMSRLNFQFDDFEILEYEEYASYKWHNFVADVGGLLGFFLGCSILSLIEIIYFFFETCAGSLRNRLKSRKITGSQRNKNLLNSYPAEDCKLEFIEKSSNNFYNQANIYPLRKNDQQLLRMQRKFYY